MRNPNASLMRTNLTRQQMKGAFDVYFISDFDTELSDVPYQKEN